MANDDEPTDNEIQIEMEHRAENDQVHEELEALRAAGLGPIDLLRMPEPDMSHAMQEALQKAKDELLANSTQVTDPDLQSDLNAIVDEAMSSTLARNLSEVIAAERIEEFRPLGLFNGPLIRIEADVVPTNAMQQFLYEGLTNVLPEDHPAAGHTSISLPKAEAFARGEHSALNTYPGHSADVTIGACRPTAPCPACRQRLEDKGEDDGQFLHCSCHGYRRGTGACPNEQSRTLMQIVGQHRAVAGASALEIYELVAELQPLLLQAVDKVTGPLVAAQENHAAVIADARQLRGDAMRDTHVGWSEDYNPDGKDAQRGGERWDEQHPGLAALLRAVDGD